MGRLPRGNARPSNEIWHCNVPVGYNTLESIMKTIRTRAQLSKVYTNYCIGATRTTVRSHAGIDADRIASVTGHRNVGGIKNYVTEPSEGRRREASNVLAKAANGDDKCFCGRGPIRQCLPIRSFYISRSSVIGNKSKLLFPQWCSMGSLFAWATIGSNCTININFSAGRY